MKTKIKKLRKNNKIKWLDSRKYKPERSGNYLTLDGLGIVNVRYYRLSEYGEVEGWISNEDTRQWQVRPTIDDEVFYWSFFQFNKPLAIEPNPFSDEAYWKDEN